MRKIALVAAGPRGNLAELIAYHDDEITWVGVDKGSLYILESDLPLAYAFGDFDSITEDEKQKLTKVVPDFRMFSPEKDKTDTELALEWALQQGPELIQIFGATGGRIDHMFGNIHLLMKSTNSDPTIEIIDYQNHITLFTSGTYTILKRKGWEYISFIPISLEVKGITLDGFKYPLNNCHIRIGSTLCISNELIHEQGTFSFHDGILLMIRSRD